MKFLYKQKNTIYHHKNIFVVIYIVDIASVVFPGHFTKRSMLFLRRHFISSLVVAVVGVVVISVVDFKLSALCPHILQVFAQSCSNILDIAWPLHIPFRLTVLQDFLRFLHSHFLHLWRHLRWIGGKCLHKLLDTSLHPSPSLQCLMSFSQSENN